MSQAEPLVLCFSKFKFRFNLFLGSLLRSYILNTQLQNPSPATESVDMDAMEPSSGADAGRRVVLFPLPYQGHLNPMLRLAAALHRRGLAIIVLHTDLQPLDPANHPTEYRFESLSADVPAELMASKDIARVVMDLNASFAAPFKDRVAALVADKESGGVDCVITDAVWFSAQAAAQELGVPSLGLFTNSAASFRTFMAYPTLIEKGYLPVQGNNWLLSEILTSA